MELGLIMKIKKDKKMYEYLLKHSYWFRALNRNPNSFEDFQKEYKKYNRDNNLNKINDAIDNAELISNVIKIIE